MGAFFINRITDKQFPNIMRDINRNRKVPLRSVWQILYQGRSINRVKPLGWQKTLREAVAAAKDYALRRLNSKNPDIKIKR